jgi:hypothetical protein
MGVTSPRTLIKNDRNNARRTTPLPKAVLSTAPNPSGFASKRAAVVSGFATREGSL